MHSKDLLGTLIHMDLSHNGFTKSDCAVLAEGLQKNRTLLGLHMIGNECNTDTLGFVRGRPSAPRVSHVLTRIQSMCSI